MKCDNLRDILLRELRNTAREYRYFQERGGEANAIYYMGRREALWDVLNLLGVDDHKIKSVIKAAEADVLMYVRR